MKHRISRLLAAALIAGSTLAMAAPEAASGVSTPVVTAANIGSSHLLDGVEVPESATIDAPVLATGRLLGPNGAGVTGLIIAQVWPSQEYVSSLPVGAGFKAITVAQARTSSDGSYQLKLDPSLLPVDYVGERSWVTIWLIGLGDDGSEARWTFTAQAVHYPEDSAESRERGAVSNKAWRDAGMEMVRGTASDMPPLFNLGANWDAVDLRAGVPIAPELPKYCYIIVDEITAPSWALVGEVNALSGSTGDFHFSAGGSTTLGVGLKVNGGSFQASGTSTRTTSVTIGFPATSSSYRAQTQFNYRRLVDQCPGATYEYLFPNNHVGGARYYIPYGVPTANHCNWYQAGTTFEKDSATAVTWSGGINVLGFSATTRSGYNSKTKITFAFSANRQLCGDTAAAPQAQRVRVKF